MLKFVVVFLAVLLVCTATDLNFDDGDETLKVEDLTNCEYETYGFPTTFQALCHTPTS